MNSCGIWNLLVKIKYWKHILAIIRRKPTSCTNNEQIVSINWVLCGFKIIIIIHFIISLKEQRRTKLSSSNVGHSGNIFDHSSHTTLPFSFPFSLSFSFSSSTFVVKKVANAGEETYERKKCLKKYEKKFQRCKRLTRGTWRNDSEIGWVDSSIRFFATYENRYSIVNKKSK